MGIKYKAVYYERVSTVHDEQAESMENQRRLCESYLKHHLEIELAEPIGAYSERISGKSDQRPRYHEMIKRIEKGDIDFLLVKDLKRLSRSTEVSSQIRNLAKKYKFKIILLATSQIFDPNLSETRLLYGFESLVNEEYVFRQSEYGRIAHRQKMEAKRLTSQNVTFGFAWDNEKQDIVIDNEKAAVVRELFDLYVFKGYGTKELLQYLETVGLSYSGVTVRKWLHETAYIGIFNMNKRGSDLGVGAGMKTKRYSLPRDEWVPVERPDLAIVDKEIFELAQKIQISRRSVYSENRNGVIQARFEGTHLFAGKVFCGECGYSYLHYYTDRKKTIGAYRDSFNQKKGNATRKCENTKYYRIYENDLISIVTTAINKILEGSGECISLLLAVIEKVLSEDRSKETKASEIRKQIANIKREISKTKSAYLDAVAKGRETLADDLGNDYDKLVAQEKEAEESLEKVLDARQGQQTVKDRIAGIEKALSNLQTVSELDRLTVQSFIERIVIHKDGNMKIYLKTEKQVNSQLEQKGRSQNDGSALFVMEEIAGKKMFDSVVKMVSHDVRY